MLPAHTVIVVQRPLEEGSVNKNKHIKFLSTFLHQDVENYYAALNKMAEDIIALRKQVMTLEAENRQLRTDLSLHQDRGENLVGDRVINETTKAEVAGLIGK